MQSTFESFEFEAMNTQVTLLAKGAELEHDFETVQQLFVTTENRFSRFKDSSELAELNRSGVLAPASHEMLQVLTSAKRHSAATDGAFNPAIHNALVASGYSDSFETLSLRSTQTTHINTYVPNIADALEIDEHNRSVRTSVPIDLGGIVKGWVVDRASDLLSSSCEGWLIDAGGDIGVGGEPPDPIGWTIGVDDPFTGRLIDVIGIRGGGVATSSTLKRNIRTQSGINHHIIDPSSGRSSRRGIAAASVIARSTELAEVVAKSIVIAGEARGMKLLEKTGAAGRITRTDGSLIVSGDWPSVDPVFADVTFTEEVA